MLKDDVDDFYVLPTFEDLSVGAYGLQLNVLHDCSM